MVVLIHRHCCAVGVAVHRAVDCELHVLKGIARPLQVDTEDGNYFVQHPDVLLGEAEVAEHLDVRG